MQPLKTFKAFYTFYGSDRHVPAESAIDLSEADIYTDLLGGLEGDRDFFGIVDSQGITLQVMYVSAKDQYWLEIPDPAAGGSHGRHCSFDEITDLLKALPETFTASAFTGLVFTPWHQQGVPWWQFWKKRSW